MGKKTKELEKKLLRRIESIEDAIFRQKYPWMQKSQLPPQWLWHFKKQHLADVAALKGEVRFDRARKDQTHKGNTGIYQPDGGPSTELGRVYTSASNAGSSNEQWVENWFWYDGWGNPLTLDFDWVYINGDELDGDRYTDQVLASAVGYAGYAREYFQYHVPTDAFDHLPDEEPDWQTAVFSLECSRNNTIEGYLFRERAGGQIMDHWMLFNGYEPASVGYKVRVRHDPAHTAEWFCLYRFLQAMKDDFPRNAYVLFGPYQWSVLPPTYDEYCTIEGI